MRATTSVDIVESMVLPFVVPHGANTSLSALFGAKIPQAFIRTEENERTVTVFLAWCGVSTRNAR